MLHLSCTGHPGVFIRSAGDHWHAGLSQRHHESAAGRSGSGEIETAVCAAPTRGSSACRKVDRLFTGIAPIVTAHSACKPDGLASEVSAALHPHGGCLFSASSPYFAAHDVFPCSGWRRALDRSLARPTQALATAWGRVGLVWYHGRHYSIAIDSQ